MGTVARYNHGSIISAAFLLFALLLSPFDASGYSLVAPDGSDVQVIRDEYGVPHIWSETEVGIFFGQGFAIAHDRMPQMEISWRAGMGRLSEAFGLEYLELDIEARTMGYTSAERMEMFDELSPEVRDIFESYVDGVNAYIDSTMTNPAEYKPYEYAEYDIEPWTVEKVIAIVTQPISPRGMNGGKELIRLVELQQNGEDWFNENRPINDPESPTTILGDEPAAQRDYHYSGITVREEVVEAIVDRKRAVLEIFDQLTVPSTLGSYMATFSPEKSDGGEAMLVGCPQMAQPAPGTSPNVLCEIEMECNTTHVTGACFPGVPGLLIGRNEFFAWSMTNGNSDNMDVYIDSTEDQSYGRYWHNDEWIDVEVLVDTIHISDARAEILTHYRTVHGPVFGADLESHQLFSMKSTPWMRHLEQTEAFYHAISSDNVDDFIASLENAPLTYNVAVAGIDGSIRYSHIGLYNDRQDGVDPRLPHKGDGTEEWVGFIPYEELPHADGTVQDYFANWNNKPVSWWDNGDNVPWVGTNHITTITEYFDMMELVNIDNMKDLPQFLDDHGSWEMGIDFSQPEKSFNICPPGQSIFVNIDGIPSPHLNDQWILYTNWVHKRWYFGEVELVVEEYPNSTILPSEFKIEGIYPNPFNAELMINLSLSQNSLLQVSVYNILGKKILDIADGNFNRGFHQFTLDAGEYASGTYLVRFNTNNNTELVRKVNLLK